MIVGIGNDIISMHRIEKVIEKFGSRFEKRIFSDLERELAWERGSPCIRTFSNRWASKEAFLKALGTGINNGISWTDISVNKRASGKPFLSIGGEAMKQLKKAIPLNSEAVVHLTISDDNPWVSAVVIIEAIRPLPKYYKFSKQKPKE